MWEKNLIANISNSTRLAQRVETHHQSVATGNSRITDKPLLPRFNHALNNFQTFRRQNNFLKKWLMTKMICLQDCGINWRPSRTMDTYKG